MQRKREYLQGELRKLDSALAERRSVREGVSRMYCHFGVTTNGLKLCLLNCRAP